jgi:hypothetical protein
MTGSATVSRTRGSRAAQRSPFEARPSRRLLGAHPRRATVRAGRQSHCRSRRRRSHPRTRRALRASPASRPARCAAAVLRRAGAGERSGRATARRVRSPAPPGPGRLIRRARGRTRAAPTARRRHPGWRPGRRAVAPLFVSPERAPARGDAISVASPRASRPSSTESTYPTSSCRRGSGPRRWSVDEARGGWADPQPPHAPRTHRHRHDARPNGYPTLAVRVRTPSVSSPRRALGTASSSGTGRGRSWELDEVAGPSRGRSSELGDDESPVR